MKAMLKFLIEHFPDLFDASITASIVILFVVCVRLLLSRAPRIFSYALWGIVLVRLLVPISVESPVSVVPEPPKISNMVEVNEVLPEIEFEAPKDHTNHAGLVQNTPSSQPLVQTSESISAETYLAIAWLIGVAVMVTHSLVSYWKLRKRVKVAIPIQKRIYIADNIDTPFVMGLFRPVIYLPGTLGKAEQEYIIAHEQHHIRRGDHIFKALGFLALTVHWFNPLVWVAFVLAGRDMEMSCDEAIIRKLGADIRADYSASLLNLATGHRLFSITPLAFGEGNPTGRVRNLAKWKKPAFWVIIICVVLCAVLTVCLLTNPKANAPKEVEEDDWGISLALHGASPTGAGWYFTNSSSAQGALTYDKYFSLEQLVDGTWTVLDELAADVTDRSYSVTDGIGLYVKWQNTIGQLADGQYRLGKQVTLTAPNGTSEERMFYCQFRLENGFIPLEELPEYYYGYQPTYDGCFTQNDGRAMTNKQLFKEFAEITQSGIPSSIRIVNTYSLVEDNTIHDLVFDGSVYTISWIEDGQRQSKQFRYLKHFTGGKEDGYAVGIEYDEYNHYVLVNDDTVTWTDIRDSGDEIDCMYVYIEYIYKYYLHYESPEIPEDIAQAALVFEGETLLTITNSDRLGDIRNLFATAEIITSEPKTHSLGINLYLVLTCQDGETVTIELDPDFDICRIGELYVHYGRYDEPSYISLLWQYLGVSKWPDPIYEKYPRAKVS